MKANQPTSLLLLGCVFFTAIVCWIDMVMPLGFAGGVPYVFVVLATIWLPRRGYTLFFGLLAVVLVVAGYFLSPEGSAQGIALANRAIAAIAIVMTGILVIGQKEHRLLLERLVSEKAEALADSTQRFRTSFDHAAIGMALVAPDGGWIEVNRALCNLLGYEADTLYALTFQDITHPDDLNADLAYVQQMLRGEIETYQMEKRYFHRDGSIVWVLLSVSAMHNEEGTVEYFISQLQDITKHKRALQALRKSEERLRMALSASQIGTWNWDIGAEELTWDDRMSQVFSLDPDGPKGYDAFKQLVHPDDFDRVMQAIEAALAGIADYDLDYRIVREDGTVGHVVAQGAILRDETGRPVSMSGIVLDITDMKRRQAERDALIAELEAQNAELERFTYTVSHDLKSPLVTIQGFTGMLRQDVKEGNTERIEEDLSYISGATETMQTLLDELLRLSRVGRLVNPPEPVSLTHLTRETVAHLAGRIAERQAEVVIAPEMPVVEVDRVRMQEVMQNLIENALKFSTGEVRVEIGAREEAGEVVCWVKDNGVGIAEAYQDRVFGLFERLDQEVEGTGIGLALVKRIVEVHGGRIWVA